jgi:hypothetical protein
MCEDETVDPIEEDNRQWSLETGRGQREVGQQMSKYSTIKKYNSIGRISSTVL